MNAARSVGYCTGVRLPLALLLCAALADCTCGSEPPCIDSECDDGLCAEGSCVEACSLEAPCEAGFACVVDDGAAGGAAHCLPTSGNTEINDPCDDDRVCASGACSGSVCVNTCTLDAPCANDLRCVLDGPQRVCVLAVDDRVDGAACDDSAQCLSGTCVRPPIPGGSGDAVCAGACDGDHACTAASDLCLPLADGARACLPALADGAACAGSDVCAGGFCIVDSGGPVCASPCDTAGGGRRCLQGFGCVDDDEGNALCLPALDDRADGEACQDLRECQSQICGRFVDGAFDVELCASPCPPEGCGPDRICWEGDDVDLCGPVP